MSAQIDGEWHALRCSTNGLDGVTLPEWIVAHRRLLAANDAGSALSQATVDRAVAEIQQVARDPRKRVGIHLELLSDERLAAAEALIGAGFTLPTRDTNRSEDRVAGDLFADTLAVGGNGSPATVPGPAAGDARSPDREATVDPFADATPVNGAAVPDVERSPTAPSRSRGRSAQGVAAFKTRAPAGRPDPPAVPPGRNHVTFED